MEEEEFSLLTGCLSGIYATVLLIVVVVFLVAIFQVG